MLFLISPRMEWYRSTISLLQSRAVSPLTHNMRRPCSKVGICTHRCALSDHIGSCKPARQICTLTVSCATVNAFEHNLLIPVVFEFASFLWLSNQATCPVPCVSHTSHMPRWSETFPVHCSLMLETLFTTTSSPELAFSESDAATEASAVKSQICCSECTHA